MKAGSQFTWDSVTRRSLPVAVDTSHRFIPPPRLDEKATHSPSGEYTGWRSVDSPRESQRPLAAATPDESVTSRRFWRGDRVSNTTRPSPSTSRTSALDGLQVCETTRPLAASCRTRIAVLPAALTTDSACR